MPVASSADFPIASAIREAYASILPHLRIEVSFMVEDFATAKAEHIASLAKTYLDTGGDRVHPIESGETAGKAKKELVAEFDALLLNKDNLRAVCLQLEKIGQKTFTSLPDIEITAEDGVLSSITFKPSIFDFDSTLRTATLSRRNVNGDFMELDNF